MSAAATTAGSPPVVDARLVEARRQVRDGALREALDTLALLADTEAGPAVDVRGRAERVALRIECLLARGELAEAAATAEQVADLVVGPGAALALQARAELASALDDHDTALALHLAAGASAESSATDADAAVPWRLGAAHALVRCGRRAEGEDLARTELALATARDDVHATAAALRTLAIIVADGEAAVRLEEARRLLGGEHSRRLAAQIDTDLAGLLVLGGELERATAMLRDTELYAVREDLWPLQSRVRRLLARVGQTPLRLEAEALAVLTTGERRVAVLALDGLSNRLIAEQLLVSIKAVEGHLSKIYRKLGVASRRELIATVGRAG
jgi:ATP/maltotriose-dependent transcriptional regulator MalT